MLEILHLFTCKKNGDGAHPVGSPVLDGDGNLYGATRAGGAYGDNNSGGTVFELTPSSRGWSETILHSFRPSDDSPSSGLVRDAEGNLYGIYGIVQGTVFQLKHNPSDGWKEHILCPCASGDANLLIDAEGNLYFNDDAGNGSVLELERAQGWQPVTLYGFLGGEDG